MTEEKEENMCRDGVPNNRPGAQLAIQQAKVYENCLMSPQFMCNISAYFSHRLNMLITNTQIATGPWQGSDSWSKPHRTRAHSQYMLLQTVLPYDEFECSHSCHCFHCRAQSTDHDCSKAIKLLECCISQCPLAISITYSLQFYPVLSDTPTVLTATADFSGRNSRSCGSRPLHLTRKARPVCPTYKLPILDGVCSTDLESWARSHHSLV
jgi:hypothetical protein